MRSSSGEEEEDGEGCESSPTLRLCKSPKQRSSSLFQITGNTDFNEIMSASPSSGPLSPNAVKFASIPELSLEGYPLLPNLVDRKQVFEPTPSSSSDRKRALSDPSVSREQGVTALPCQEVFPEPLSPPLVSSTPISNPPPPAGTRLGKPRVGMLMRRSSAAAPGEEVETEAQSPRRSFVISPFRSSTPTPAVVIPPALGLRRSTSLTSFLFAGSSASKPSTPTPSSRTLPSASIGSSNNKPLSRKMSSDLSFSTILQRLRSTSGDYQPRNSPKSPKAELSSMPSPLTTAATPSSLLSSSFQDARLLEVRSRDSSIFEDPGRLLPSQSVTSSVLSDTSEDQHHSAMQYTKRRDTLDQHSEDFDEDLLLLYEEGGNGGGSGTGGVGGEEDNEEEEEAKMVAAAAAAAKEEAEEMDGIPDFAPLDELLAKIGAIKDRGKRSYWLDVLLSAGLDFNRAMGPSWFTQSVLEFVNKSRQLDVLERWLVRFGGMRTCFPFLEADAGLVIVLSSFSDNNKTALGLLQLVEQHRRQLSVQPAHFQMGKEERSQSFGGMEHEPMVIEGEYVREALSCNEERMTSPCRYTAKPEPFLAKMLHWPQPELLPPLPVPPHSRPASNSLGGSGHSRQNSLNFSLKRGSSFTSSLTSLFQLTEEGLGLLKRTDPTLVAQQLMQIMCTQAYSELSFKSLRTVEGRKMDTHVQRLVRVFEVLSYWPVSEILLDPKRTAWERIEDFGFFCQVAKESRRLGNFHAVFALVGSLQSPLLKWVEKMATRKDKADFCALQRMCRTDNNYRVYFADLSKRDPAMPCVPYLGLLNRTLLALQVEAPVFSPIESGGGINVQRLRRIWKELSSYLQFQLSRSELPYVDELVRRSLVDSMAKSVLDYGELTARSMQAKASYKKSARQRALHRARAMGHQIVGNADGI